MKSQAATAWEVSSKAVVVLEVQLHVRRSARRQARPVTDATRTFCFLLNEDSISLPSYTSHRFILPPKCLYVPQPPSLPRVIATTLLQGLVISPPTWTIATASQHASHPQSTPKSLLSKPSSKMDVLSPLAHPRRSNYIPCVCGSSS